MVFCENSSRRAVFRGYSLREALAYTNKAYPGRADGLHPDTAYSGCEDSFAFQAGSYMYYSKWRNRLAEMAGLGSTEAVSDELKRKGILLSIDFSIARGRSELKGAAKLAKDFADYEFTASAFAVEFNDDFFLALYREWWRAFDGPPMAAWFILASVPIRKSYPFARRQENDGQTGTTP